MRVEHSKVLQDCLNFSTEIAKYYGKIINIATILENGIWSYF